MELDLKPSNDFNPEILYINLRRPEVDKLFRMKDDLVADVQFFKSQIHNSDDEAVNNNLQKRIAKLLPEINALDTQARKLWREIKLKAKEQ